MKTLRQIVSDGNQTLLDIDFDLGYLERLHIFVYVGEDHTLYETQMTYMWMNDTQIELLDTEEFPVGTKINIRRVVPSNELYTLFKNSVGMTQLSLNSGNLQSLMLIEEVQDGFKPEGYSEKQDLDFGGLYTIKNLPDGIDDGDPITVHQIYDIEGTIGGILIGVEDAADRAEDAADEARDLVILGERSDAIATKYFTATEGQTEFVLTTPNDENNLLVFMNTRKLRITEDYTVDAPLVTKIILNNAADTGDELDIVNINTYDLTGMSDDMIAAVNDAQVAQVAAEAARDTAFVAAGNAVGSATDAQGYAYSAETWAEIAQSVACQDLEAIQEIVDSSTSLVDVFIYDTSKDSDGGAWRKRCQNLTWYNETLNTSTRGATKEFPAVALPVAETAIVTLYDLTDPSVPMWRVHDFTGYVVTAVKISNSKLIVSTTVGLYTFDYLSEEEVWYTTTSTPAIVDNSCNDTAMTVLPDAPVDQVTELPVPTRLVPTAAGASWIKDDGTAVDATGIINLIAADINSSGLSVMVSASTAYIFKDIPSADIALTSADYITSPVGTITSVELNGLDIIIGTSEGFIVTKYNGISPTDSMAFQITSSYFSGIMKGDIKLATLADSMVGDITSADPVEDRSVNDNPLQVIGTITKAPVATGSELMAYSGYSVMDYIEQPYNSDLDFGTGDFYVMGWLETSQGSGSAEYMFERAKPGSATNYLYIRRTSSSGDLGVGMAGMAAIEVPGILENNVPQLILIYVKSNVLYVFVDGVQVASAATTGSMTIIDAIVRLGVRAYSVSDPGIYQSLTLWRMGSGSPSDEQIKDIFEMEKKLFEEDAKCTLLGSNDSVEALSFDEVTSKLSVLTDTVNQFQEVVSVNQEVLNGAGVAIDTYKDGLSVATAAEVIYTRPAFLLREELEAKNLELSKALAPLVEWDYASATSFKIPMGYYPVDVYNATGKYARSGVAISYDGYNYWCTISVASAVYITGRRV